MTGPPGTRKGRARSGISCRSATMVRVPAPKESTVADVTKPTSCCQLGNGRNTMSPMKNVTSRLTNGTPRFVVLASDCGALPLRPMA